MHTLLNIAKHWAIEPDYLKVMASELSTMSISNGNLLKNQAAINRQNSIAVIPIQGPITAQETFLSSLLGGISLDNFVNDFQKSLNDDSVKAILLNVDSPGGVAVGPQEVADMIYQARSQKPIWAYISRHGCSAAYWLAASCEKVIANRSALVGSIGVVSTVPVQETPDSEGYRHVEIVSSNAQHKRPDPRTADGMQEIRRELDSLETEFIASVAKSRNVSTMTVQQDFGQGGVLVGCDAKACNMVDELSTFNEVLINLMQNIQLTESKSINQLQDRRKSIMKEISTQHHEPSPEAASNTVTENVETITASPLMSANYIKEQYPFVYDSIKQHGFELGAKAEHERLTSIDNATMPGYEELASKAKDDSLMTGEKFALQIVSLEKSKGNHFIQNANVAENELPDITPNVEPTTNPNNISLDAPIDVKAKATWESDAKVRAEFGEFETYVAYCEAFGNGQVKILGQPEGTLS